MSHTLDHPVPAPAGAFIVADISDEEITRLCHENQNLNVIQHGRCFKRISDDVIVKFGWSVTPDEAANQQFAHELSRETKIKIPKVYRFFSRSSVGYIVMEFIHGDLLEKVPVQDRSIIIHDLAKAISTLSTAQSPDFPGPRAGGIPRGYLFSDDGAGESLDTIDKINSWFNKRARLEPLEQKFNFKLSDCIFCHMDLNPRNIIVRDTCFYVLDWEFAGFYPGEFEKYSILFNGQREDSQFAEDLSRALEHEYQKTGIKANDAFTVNLLDRVYHNNLRYSLWVESVPSNATN
ncbi:hypothetical protein N7523_005550 [Penicillium sp. IBT 18751x]|nr:hypothetical protein N7523_005865 [Penicillium sp. IBT 18751x]KAJ6117799.1 hypothetical protein N7523_005550 [Penicillium sp. IBT 18751x]